MTSGIMILPLLAIGYLIGSVSFAYLLTRAVAGKDIRTLGTGNPGAANVARTVGKGWGMLVWLGDTLKGILSMSIASAFGIFHPVLLTMVGLSAAAGHCFPVFLGLRGGKGVAVSGAIVLYLIPWAFPVVVLLWFLVQAINPRSRAVALSATAAFFLILFALDPGQFPVLSVCVLLIIAFDMLTNLATFRLMAHGGSS